MRLRPYFLVIAVAANTALGAPEPITFESTESQVALIELFTSEGCSSCPPAEAWLNKLRDDPGLWREFVPVAFHVDYWDRLGWRDRFARRDFTERQYALAAAWRSRTVYTPCFVRNGEEWRTRRLEHGQTTVAGKLRLDLSTDRRLVVHFAPPAPDSQTHYDIFVALLAAEIESDVRAGENAGRRLKHQFVALTLERATLASNAGDAWTATLELAAPTTLPAEPRAIAAWVVSRDSLTPLQAVGGWLPAESSPGEK